MLLSREAFKLEVFKRDSYLCVFCKNKAVDAHHIMDRKLFGDGGYYINNGISVCAEDHFLCENSTYSVEQARQAANITEIVLPKYFDPKKIYNKWGDQLLEDGFRIKGPLFNDTAVQKLFKHDMWRYL